MRREASPVTTAPVTSATLHAPSRFGYATHLSCRECGHTCQLGPQHACDECFGPLEVAYDLPPLNRASIEPGPLSMWRYALFLPVAPDGAAVPNRDPAGPRRV